MAALLGILFTAAWLNPSTATLEREWDADTFAAQQVGANAVADALQHLGELDSQHAAEQAVNYTGGTHLHWKDRVSLLRRVALGEIPTLPVRKRRGVLLQLAMAVGAFAILLGYATFHHPDPRRLTPAQARGQFLRAITQNHLVVDGTDDEVVQDAHDVCAAAQKTAEVFQPAGFSTYVVLNGTGGSPFTYTGDRQGALFVEAAEYYFCYRYYPH